MSIWADVGHIFCGDSVWKGTLTPWALCPQDLNKRRQNCSHSFPTNQSKSKGPLNLQSWPPFPVMSVISTDICLLHLWSSDSGATGSGVMGQCLNKTQSTQGSELTKGENTILKAVPVQLWHNCRECATRNCFLWYCFLQTGYYYYYLLLL